MISTGQNVVLEMLVIFVSKSRSIFVDRRKCEIGESLERMERKDKLERETDEKMVNKREGSDLSEKSTEINVWMSKICSCRF